MHLIRCNKCRCEVDVFGNVIKTLTVHYGQEWSHTYHLCDECAALLGAKVRVLVADFVSRYEVGDG